MLYLFCMCWTKTLEIEKFNHLINEILLWKITSFKVFSLFLSFVKRFWILYNQHYSNLLIFSKLRPLFNLFLVSLVARVRSRRFIQISQIFLFSEQPQDQGDKFQRLVTKFLKNFSSLPLDRINKEKYSAVTSLFLSLPWPLSPSQKMNE